MKPSTPFSYTIAEFPGKYPVLRAYSSDVGAASGGEPPLPVLGPWYGMNLCHLGRPRYVRRRQYRGHQIHGHRAGLSPGMIQLPPARHGFRY